MHRDIQRFVDVLRAEGEIIEIDAEVDPNLEMAEVHRRVIAADGPALLFKNPTGYDIPVATNLFGTPKRVDLAFGGKPTEFVRRAVHLATKELMPPTFGKIWENRDLVWQASKIGMRRMPSGPVTEVVHRPPRIDRIPMLKSWPEDGGHFVTLPLVYTEPPSGHGGPQPRHVPDPALRLQDHHRHAHGRSARAAASTTTSPIQRGEDLPVTLFVGGPTSADRSPPSRPCPRTCPSCCWPACSLGERLPMAPQPRRAPAPLVSHCEFAFVGHVKPHEVAVPRAPSATTTATTA